MLGLRQSLYQSKDMNSVMSKITPCQISNVMVWHHVICEQIKKIFAKSEPQHLKSPTLRSVVIRKFHTHLWKRAQLHSFSSYEHLITTCSRERTPENWYLSHYKPHDIKSHVKQSHCLNSQSQNHTAGMAVAVYLHLHRDRIKCTNVWFGFEKIRKQYCREKTEKETES